MIREQSTEEQHRAWLANLSAEENTLVMIPDGYKFSMLIIAYFKHVLVSDSMSDAERLWTLEAINSMIDSYLSQEMVARIDPMSDTEARMFGEAASADRGSKGCKASYKILTEHKTFKLFVDRNEGLRQAIRMRGKAA